MARPMTRDEFLQAWKQRGFCPLIDEQGNIESVCSVCSDADNTIPVTLSYAGDCGFIELSHYRFAFDESPCFVTE